MYKNGRRTAEKWQFFSYQGQIDLVRKARQYFEHLCVLLTDFIRTNRLLWRVVRPHVHMCRLLTCPDMHPDQDEKTNHPSGGPSTYCFFLFTCLTVWPIIKVRDFCFHSLLEICLCKHKPNRLKIKQRIQFAPGPYRGNGLSGVSTNKKCNLDQFFFFWTRFYIWNGGKEVIRLWARWDLEGVTTTGRTLTQYKTRRW